MRTYERGSVIGFVVVGVVLAALLVGSILWVRQVASRPQQAPVTTDQQTATKNEDAAKPAATSAQDAEKKANEQLQQQRAEEASRQKQNNSPQAPASQSASPESLGTVRSGQSPAAESLPQTGPVDTLLTAISLGSVVALMTAYRRSRQLL